MSLAEIWGKIRQYEAEYSRSPGEVRLVAVSKQRSPSDVKAMFALGQRDFAENTLQEAIHKMEATSMLGITWHFIGRIQANKTRAIAEHFSWVHSIDRLRVATRLAVARPAEKPPMNVCIQVNIDNEATKAGVHLDDVERLADQIRALSTLRLRGLMAVPRPRNSFSEQIKPYQQLADKLALLNAKGYKMDTLSMGMSKDFKAAIAAGATIVRLGNAVFGSRL